MANEKPTGDQTPESAPPPGRLRRWGGPVLYVAAPLLVTSAAYALLCVLLWRPVRSDTQAVLTRDQVLCAVLNYQPRPGWITDSEWRRFAELGLVAEGKGVFEAGISERLVKSYESSPWIESVGAVRIRYPGAVGLERITFRTPYVRLVNETRGMVLDRSGCVLPLDANEPDDATPAGTNGSTPRGRLDLPAIVGLRFRMANVKEHVESPELTEAFALLEQSKELFSRVPGKQEVARVVKQSAGTWQVVTKTGLSIEWGFYQDTQRPQGEPTLREKRHALLRRLTEVDPRRLECIRLYAPNAPVIPKQ